MLKKITIFVLLINTIFLVSCQENSDIKIEKPVLTSISNFEECEKNGGQIKKTLMHRDCTTQDGRNFIEGLNDKSKEFTIDKQKWSLMKELYQGAEDFYTIFKI